MRGVWSEKKKDILSTVIEIFIDFLLYTEISSRNTFDIFVPFDFTPPIVFYFQGQPHPKVVKTQNQRVKIRK